MLYNLEKFSSDYLKFTTEELFLLASLFEPAIYQEDNFIIKKGQLISDIYFLNNGVLKSYRECHKEEIKIKFYFGPVFFSDLNALHTKTETTRNFVAFRESEVFIAKFEAIKNLNQKSKKHNTFFKMLYRDSYLFDFEKCA